MQAHPQHLRVFPSCSIARVEPGPAADGARVAAIAAGAALTPADGQCCARTAYEVMLGPLRLAGARFAAAIAAPARTRLPPRASALISLVIEVDAGNVNAGAAARGMRSLRLFIDGEAAFCATLRDALLMRVACAYVESAADGRWSLLDAIPLRALGFAERDALIPPRQGESVAERLLAEYLAFAEKFHFIELDIGPLLAYLPPGGRRLTLHLALADVAADSPIAARLASLSAAHFLAGCTPVVGLFAPKDAPFGAPPAFDYTVAADAGRGHHRLRLFGRISPTRHFSAAADGRGRPPAPPRRALNRDGLPAFLLWLLGADPAPQWRRQVAAIVDLERGPAISWLGGRRGGGMCHGMEVRVTVDESVFADGGMHLFAQLVDHFLAQYAEPDSFIQLLVLSEQTGLQLLRCAPREGERQAPRHLALQPR
ncbi:MAG TPA: hypothetical protein DCW29_10655 [Janthinobacterium sp.]|nr:hypothetical protein [Janthinobacterium sp.]